MEHSLDDANDDCSEVKEINSPDTDKNIDAVIDNAAPGQVIVDDMFADEDMTEEFFGFPSTNKDFESSRRIRTTDFRNSSESSSFNENNDQSTPRRSSRMNKGEPPSRYNVSSF